MICKNIQRYSISENEFIELIKKGYPNVKLHVMTINSSNFVQEVIEVRIDIIAFTILIPQFLEVNFIFWFQKLWAQ